MHRAHKGYTPEQWRAAAAAASVSVGARATGYDSFGAAAAAAPAATGPSPDVAPGSAGPALPPAMQQLSERFSRCKDSMGKAFGVLTARGLEHFLKLKERLSASDEATLTDGWSATLDCLDIKPQFSKREIALTSPLWALLFPILAVLLVAAQQFDLTAVLQKWEAERERAAKSNSRDHRAEGKREDPPSHQDSKSVQ